MRFEKLLRHRGCGPVAPSWGQRRKNDRRVHVTLMIGREDYWSRLRVEMLEAVHLEPRKNARKRQNPRRQARTPDRSRRPRLVPVRKVDRFGRWCVAVCGSLDNCSQLAEVASPRKRRFVEMRLEGILESHHQLNSLQGRQSKLFDRRAGR